MRCCHLPCCCHGRYRQSGKVSALASVCATHVILILSAILCFCSPSSAAMSAFDFSRWPPPLTDDQLATLTLEATTYALAHGLNYLPPGPTQPPSPSSAIHAPISLLPSPVPRTLFLNAQRLQSVYNKLYARVATDDDFLDQVMGAEKGVGQADEFVRRLWQGWKQIREEETVQVSSSLRLIRQIAH